MTVLAELLAERKDLVTKIATLDEAIAAALVYDEEDDETQTRVIAKTTRAEADRLYGELTTSLDRLQEVENQVRSANMGYGITFDGKKLTISQAIVLRDRLTTEYHARKKIADEVADSIEIKKAYRYGERRKKDDIKTLSAIDPRDLVEDADAVAKKRRLLDIEIQKANWSVEV